MLYIYNPCIKFLVRVQYSTVQYFLQDLEELKRTEYKINGTATTAIRVRYEYSRKF